MFLYVVIAALIAILISVPCLPVTARAENGGQDVYIGGFPVGISVDIGGLLVEEITGVETKYGVSYVDGIQKGDVIQSINGHAVSSVDDIKKYLGDGEADITLLRNDNRLNITVTPVNDVYSNEPRLGIKIKEKIYGIGTVTFVREDGSFAALGHEIDDPAATSHLPFDTGKIHACKLIGIKKGKKGEAGSLLASIISDIEYGTITCNNEFGLGGYYTSPIEGEKLPVASRYEVTPGSAQIRTTVDGTPEYYDIEIIKASPKGGKKQKSIVFRVTDKRLLSAAGGIVRGMSGSPIIKNGKLVGAVTHVFLNDFTKGYGVYADCLN